MKLLCHINPAVFETTGVDITHHKFPEAGDKIAWAEVTSTGGYVRPDTIVRVLDRRSDDSDYDAEVWTATATPAL